MEWFRPTRRQLVVAGVGACGLVLGAFLVRPRRRRKPVPPRPEAFSPSVYLAVDTDETVRIWLTRTEMGQGVMTALPMLVAEELDADWDRVKVVQAVALANYGEMLTGVSTSVRENWRELREGGALARQMLVAAAAQRWGLSPSSCRTERGRVFGPEDQVASFGELAEEAARQALPSRPRLKPRSALTLIGQSPVRVDLRDKVTGRAVFGMDVRPPEMRYAAVLRAPKLGAELERFDETSALSLPGVLSVHRLPSGAAVLAEDTWSALEGKKALSAGAVWTEPTSAIHSDEVWSRLEAAVSGPGLKVMEVGRRPSKREARVLEAEYRLPFLAHATMEPMNCTARVDPDGAEVWAPTQAPDHLRDQAAGWLGLPPERIFVHTTFVGGGFGRRVQHDFAEEAVRLARITGHTVQLVFSREDDLRHDFYRPPALHQLRADLDEQGQPRGWSHRIASPSILGQRDPAYEKVDPVAVEGAHIPYVIPYIDVRYMNAHVGVPLGFWRSVGHSHTAFAVECFMDELAAAAGEDPVAFRRRWLSDAPRHRAVLDRVAEASKWGSPLPEGKARGVAIHASFGSWVAQVVEVSRAPAGSFKVERVTAAVDAGWLVHPDTVRAQIEGGIIFGLTAALTGKITLNEGAVQESNFHDYPLLRMAESPQIEVHLIESEEAPGGVGEIGVPPVAPALANALASLTGERTRTLPFR